MNNKTAFFTLLTNPQSIRTYKQQSCRRQARWPSTKRHTHATTIQMASVLAHRQVKRLPQQPAPHSSIHGLRRSSQRQQTNHRTPTSANPASAPPPTASAPGPTYGCSPTVPREPYSTLGSQRRRAGICVRCFWSVGAARDVAVTLKSGRFICLLPARLRVGYTRRGARRKSHLLQQLTVEA